ncbi:Spidroin-1-like protein [Argiope bruennichi]|uniref:Spidroin-1-like protein n=1 Tax=Argiope bruennichi TaxID=94029 RepID=A0A8T0EQC5_ARGBR|nr:Spidroin-1-like protein [Argiope bruennichi]
MVRDEGHGVGLGGAGGAGAASAAAAAGGQGGRGGFGGLGSQGAGGAGQGGSSAAAAAAAAGGDDGAGRGGFGHGLGFGAVLVGAGGVERQCPLQPLAAVKEGRGGFGRLGSQGAGGAGQGGSGAAAAAAAAGGDGGSGLEARCGRGYGPVLGGQGGKLGGAASAAAAVGGQGGRGGILQQIRLVERRFGLGGCAGRVIWAGLGGAGWSWLAASAVQPRRVKEERADLGIRFQEMEHVRAGQGDGSGGRVRCSLQTVDDGGGAGGAGAASAAASAAASRLSSPSAASRVSSAVTSLISGGGPTNPAALSNTFSNVVYQISVSSPGLSGCDVLIQALLELVSALVHILGSANIGQVNSSAAGESASLVGQSVYHAFS